MGNLACFGIKLVGLNLGFVDWILWSLYIGFEICFVKIHCD
jgi:hypothetical protein